MKTERIVLIRRNLYLTLCLPALLVLLALASSRCPTMAASGGGLCSPPADGLVGWWRGEGNANDAVGINNGTVQPGTSFAAGMVGQAFSFNPANGTMIVPDSPSLRLTNQLTIEAWINNRSTNGDRAIVSKVGGVDGNNGYQMYMRGDKLMAQFNSLGLSWPAFVIQSPLSFATGVWYHVAWTYDQSAMKLYVNGLPWATNVVGPHPIAATRSTLRLSGDDNNHVYFDGLIDEASIYQRALSASEIAAIYNASSAGKCPIASSNNCVPAPGDMVSWWRAEANSLDAKGMNNGTLQNGVTFTAGRVGQAFNFDGLTGSVLVPDSGSLRLTNQFTLEAWVNTRSTNTDRSIVSKVGGAGGNNGYQLAFSRNALLGQFNQPGQAWPGYRVSYPAPLVLGTWNHVACTYDHSALKLYWNGVPVATNTVGAQVIAVSSSNLRIGDDDSHNTPFDGLIDEPTVYGRALSAGEIAAIYDAGSAGKCPTGTPPSIVTPPASQTATAGSTVSFSVTAVGDAPLRYQWRFQGVNLTGNTNSSLTLPNVQLANAGSYSVVVSNVAGSVTSSNALLTVLPFSNNCVPPSEGLAGWWRGEGTGSDAAGTNGGILQGSVTYGAGEVGQAFNLNGAGSYVQVPDNDLWAFGTANFTIELWANFNAVPGGLYSEPAGGALIANDEGPYEVSKWWVALGGGLLTFHVNSPSLGPIFLFKTPFTPLTNRWYHLAVVRSGNVFTLYRDGVAVASDTNSVAVPNPKAPLTIGRAEGFYFNGRLDEVSIYRRNLSANEIAAIYNAGPAGKCPVGIAPSIVTQPASQTATIGGTVSFSVTAAGDAPLRYQWRFQGANLPGGTNSSLNISNAQLANAGSYSVAVSNLVGSVTSSNALLTVVTASNNCVPAPAGLVSWWRGEGDALDAMRANNGTLQNGVSFSAGKVGQAFGFDGITNYVSLPASASLNVGLGAGFTIECWIKPGDISTGRPLVEWNNGITYGTHFWIYGNPQSIFVNVLDTSGVSHNLNAPAFILNTNDFQHVAATYDKASGVATLYLNGLAVASAGFGSVTPQTSYNMYLGRRPAGVTSGYYKGVMDEVSLYGRALSAGEIKAIYAAGSAGKCPIGTAPSIVTQPVSQTATVGSTVSFSVTAVGDAPLSYQWRFQGASLAGKTTSSLSLVNVQLTNAGSYSVLVSNLTGSVTSSNAILTVISASNNCVPPPAGLVSWWRGEGTANDSADSNHGILRGAMAFVSGEVGSAFSFNGTNADVRVPASASLNIGAGNGLTLETWVKPASVAQQQPLLEWNSGSFGAHMWISVVPLGGGAGQGSLFVNLKDTHFTDHSFTTPGGVLASNVWQHVAATYNKTNGNVALYVNGALINQTNLGVFTPMTTGDLYFGVRPFDASAGTRYTGQMDEIAVFNRPLSADEIAAIYRAGSAGKCPLGVPPSIVSQPQSQTAFVGGTVAFGVAVSGDAPLRYQWRFQGVNLTGNTNSSLTLSNVQLASAGSYSVVVSNLAGSVTSSNAVLTVIGSSNHCVPAPAGLVSWWRAEGAATDSAGTNNGIVAGGSAFGAGEVGQAFSFDGISGYVSIPPSPSLNVGLGAGFTIECWIKPGDISTGHPLVEWNNSVTYGTHFWIYGNPQSIFLNVLDTSGVSHNLNAPANILNTTNLQHVAGTYDKASGVATLYLNGVAVASAGFGSVTPQTSYNMFLGRRPAGVTSGYYKGLMDEVSLYGRALSPTEIAAIYATGGAGKCQTAVPPSILSQPASQTATVGSTVTFNVGAVGDAPLRYQWRFQGLNLTGNTNSSLTLSNVQLANAGSYSVVVSSLVGSVTSSNALLSVNALACVPVSSNLVAWWQGEQNSRDALGSNHGVAHANTTFADGEVGAAFNLDGASGYIAMPASASLNVGTGGGLSLEAWIKPASATANEAVFEWDNGLGQAGVQMWLSQAPPYGTGSGCIYANLIDTTGAFHTITTSSGIIQSNVFQHVALTYDKASGAVRLYYNGALAASQSLGSFTPQTSYDFDLGHRAAAPPPGFYGGLIDEVSLYSRALSAAEIQGIYNAGSAGKCKNALPPTITTEPASRSALVGDTVTFSVTAVGDAPLRYQWRFQGLNLTGNTNSSLTLSNVQLANTGSYSVVVSNLAGSVTSSNALLSVFVNALPCVPVSSNLVAWWQGEQNSRDAVGSNHGVAYGNATFSGGEVGAAFNLDGASGYIAMPASASLNVGTGGGLSLEAWIKPASATANEAVFEWDNGLGQAGVQMWLSQAPPYGTGPGCIYANLIDTTGAFHTITTSSGIIQSNVFQHVALTYDKATGAVRLYYNGALAASQSLGGFTPQTSYGFYLGHRAAAPPPGFYGGLIDEVSLYSRALSAAEIQGIYNVGTAGKCPIGTPPSIISQPQSQTVLVGGIVAFSVNAVGDAPLRYQWRFQGLNLIGNTNSSLTLSNVQLASAGSYSVVVSNLAGAVTSSNALLTVMTSSNNCAPAPAGLVSWWRAEGAATDSAGTNNGVVEGGAAFRTGEVGQAFSFNGTNADVRVSASASLNVGLADGFTIETWINPADVAQWHPMMEWNNGSVGVNFGIGDGSGAGHGVLWVSVKDILFIEHSLTTPTGLLVSNVWQHVAATYTKTNGYTVLYLNGVPRAQAALGVFTPRTVGDLYFGLRPFDGGAGTRFVGLMDEVSLYRRALSADEIAAIYHAASAGKCPIVIKAFGNPDAASIVNLLRLHGTFHSDGGTRLAFLGQQGRSYRIEVSADLVNWAALGTCTGGLDGNVEFTDVNAAHQSPRFYRAVEE